MIGPHVHMSLITIKVEIEIFFKRMAEYIFLNTSLIYTMLCEIYKH